MRYVLAKAHEKLDAQTYRIYVTDILANFTGATENGVPRYADMIDRTPVDTRSPEEIINNIKNKLKGGE